MEVPAVMKKGKGPTQKEEETQSPTQPNNEEEGPKEQESQLWWQAVDFEVVLYAMKRRVQFHHLYAGENDPLKLPYLGKQSSTIESVDHTHREEHRYRPTPSATFAALLETGEGGRIRDGVHFLDSPLHDKKKQTKGRFTHPELSTSLKRYWNHGRRTRPGRWARSRTSAMHPEHLSAWELLEGDANAKGAHAYQLWASTGAPAGVKQEKDDEYTYDYNTDEEAVGLETKSEEAVKEEQQEELNPLEWKGGSGKFGLLKDPKSRGSDPANLNYEGGMRNPANTVNGMPNAQTLGI
eukprot:s503_g29.t1